MERRNFRAEFEKLERHCADACVAIFKHYGITKLRFRGTTTKIKDDDGETPYFIDAIKLANSNAEIDFCEYFDLLDDEGQWWTGGNFKLNWLDLYECINDAIDYNLKNNIPISEWSDGIGDPEEGDDEENEEDESE